MYRYLGILLFAARQNTRSQATIRYALLKKVRFIVVKDILRLKASKCLPNSIYLKHSRLGASKLAILRTISDTSTFLKNV